MVGSLEFEKFAGQLVADGIDTNIPMTTLEAGNVDTSKRIETLMTKIGEIVIQTVRVFESPIGRFVKRSNMPYGAYVEDVAIKDGTPNKKRDGTCYPKGQVPLASSLSASNYAYHEEIEIVEHSLNKAVMNANQLGSIVAQKMRAPMKVIGRLYHSALAQLVTDVIAGIRTIQSTTKSDGTGTPVSYMPGPTQVTKKIGLTEDSTYAVTNTGKSATVSDTDGLGILRTIRDTLADMRDDTDTYTINGVRTMIEDPWVIMETKVLNAIDDALVDASSVKAILGKNSREAIANAGARLCEIPAFPVLYDTKSTRRMLAGIFDGDSIREHILWQDSRSCQCANRFATGYVFGGESILAISPNLPSYALLSATGTQSATMKKAVTEEKE